MIDVIYLCGGEGIRSKLGYPKQYYILGGKPLLIHGLETLNKNVSIRDIIIPTNEKEKIKKMCSNYNISLCKFCSAGKTRQQSVFYGLLEVETSYVLIAEGVRPFISSKLLDIIIKYQLCQALTPVIGLKSTPIKIIDTVADSINRNNIFEVQMPQRFRTDILKECHKMAQKIANENNDYNYLNYTDDVALLNNIDSGIEINTIIGEEENIKVTTPLDLKIAEIIYKTKCGVNDD